MEYFRQFDDLGVISVNQWYVLDFGILPHEEDGADTSGTRTAMTGTGEGGDFFSSTQIPSRGISTVEVRYGEDSILDVEKAKTILCQDCLDRLLSVMETYGPGRGKNQSPGSVSGGFSDAGTVLPAGAVCQLVTSGIIMCGWIRQRTGMEIEAVYAPERD